MKEIDLNKIDLSSVILKSDEFIANYSNLEEKIKTKKKTKFRIGSVSKP